MTGHAGAAAGPSWEWWGKAMEKRHTAGASGQSSPHPDSAASALPGGSGGPPPGAGTGAGSAGGSGGPSSRAGTGAGAEGGSGEPPPRAGTGAGGIPEPVTPEGRAGLAALLRDPGSALIGLDYDGTLAPIVADPLTARAHHGAVAALRRLSTRLGTLVLITGRPAETAVELGGLADVPRMVVLGHYGAERWESGVLSAPPPPPGLTAVRRALPGVLADAGAPPGTWIEDKGYAVAVHTRRAADPDHALALLREPLAALAGRAGLAVEPGRMVIELRPPGMDKGAALADLVAQRMPRAVMFCGDDLGDLAAFAKVRELRSAGVPGVTVCSGSAESPAIAEAADLVVDGPDGMIALLNAIATAVGAD